MVLEQDLRVDHPLAQPLSQGRELKQLSEHPRGLASIVHQISFGPDLAGTAIPDKFFLRGKLSHVMLVADFVNIGGDLGKFEGAKLQAEVFYKGYESLRSLFVKDSADNGRFFNLTRAYMTAVLDAPRGISVAGDGPLFTFYVADIGIK